MKVGYRKFISSISSPAARSHGNPPTVLTTALILIMTTATFACTEATPSAHLNSPVPADEVNDHGPDQATPTSLGSLAVKWEVELDVLTALPLNSSPHQDDYLVVTPSTQTIQAYYDTEVPMAGLMAADGLDDLRMVIETDQGTEFTVPGEAGIAQLRFDLTEADVPSGETGSVTILAGERILSQTGPIILFPITGDANGDGVFDEQDLTQVMIEGLYETGAPAGWTEGDWNDSGTADSEDFVDAYVEGEYLKPLRLTLPNQPALRTLDSVFYYEDELDYILETVDQPAGNRRSVAASQSCQMVCTLYATIDQESEEISGTDGPHYTVEHNFDDPEEACFHDDSCLTATGAREECASPDDQTESGWTDGTDYQSASCPAFDNKEHESSLSNEASCAQTINPVMSCDYINCNNEDGGHKECHYTMKSSYEGLAEGNWTRTGALEWEHPISGPKYDTIEDPSLNPSSDMSVQIITPGMTKEAHWSFYTSPGLVSLGGFALENAPEDTEDPDSAVCKEVEKLYYSGKIFVTCYAEVSSSDLPKAVCRVGATVEVGSKIDLTQAASCLIDMDDDETKGTPLQAQIGPTDENRMVPIKQTIWSRNPTGGYDFGTLGIKTSSNTSANSYSKRYSKPWGIPNDEHPDHFVTVQEFQESSSEAKVSASVKAHLQVQGEGCHVAPPVRYRPELRDKLIVDDTIEVKCGTRDDYVNGISGK